MGLINELMEALQKKKKLKFLDLQIQIMGSNFYFISATVDRFLDWVPIKKTTQGRLNKCQILHLSVTIRLIDRSQ